MCGETWDIHTATAIRQASMGHQAPHQEARCWREIEKDAGIDAAHEMERGLRSKRQRVHRARAAMPCVCMRRRVSLG